jgi:predicted transcriptional regulator
MRCADVMSTDVAFAHGEDEVGGADRVMKRRDIPFLPVCDAAGKVIGFVTHQHITRIAVADDVGPSTPVRDVMGRDVFTALRRTT